MNVNSKINFFVMRVHCVATVKQRLSDNVGLPSSRIVTDNLGAIDQKLNVALKSLDVVLHNPCFSLPYIFYLL